MIIHITTNNEKLSYHITNFIIITQRKVIWKNNFFSLNVSIKEFYTNNVSPLNP